MKTISELNFIYQDICNKLIENKIALQKTNTKNKKIIRRLNYNYSDMRMFVLHLNYYNVLGKFDVDALNEKKPLYLNRIKELEQEMNNYQDKIGKCKNLRTKGVIIEDLERMVIFVEIIDYVLDLNDDFIKRLEKMEKEI